MQTRQVVFVPGWDAEREGVAQTEGYGAGAFFPCFIGGQPRALLAVGTRTGRDWTEQERSVFQAVGSSLQLALERAEGATQLKAQNAELAARTQALEAFAQLTGDLGTQQGHAALIRRALEVVMSLLPPGYAALWEIRGDRWFASVQVNDVGNPALQAAIDLGLPVGQAPTLDIPHDTLEGYFQDAYTQGVDTAPEVVSHIQAVACVPLLVNGEVGGIVNVPLFETRSWNAVDRAVLTTVVQSLGLALERAQGLISLAERSQELERSNAELLAANEELDAFAYSASHDLRTPVRHIVGFNQLLRKNLGDDLDPQSAHYLKVIGEAATRMNTLIDAMLDLARTSPSG